jgi:hypothetical protein
MIADCAKSRTAAVAMALVAAAFSVVLAWPEVQLASVPVNDNSFHIELAQGLARAAKEGTSVLDPWFGEWVLGYPVFHSYQPLPAMIVALVHAIFGGSFADTLCALQLLYMALFPFSILIGARLCGLTWIESGLSALISPLVSAAGLYGLDLDSYLWRGPGLHTQLMTSLILPIAVGCTSRAITEARGRIWLAGLLVGLCLLGHLFFGYVVGLSAPLFLLSRRGDAKDRSARLVAVGAAALMVAGSLLLPMLIDGAGVLHSRYEPTWKWDGLGHREVLRALLSGELFDKGRLPVLSIALLIGLIAAGLDRDRGRRVLVALFALWCILLMGRSTFGWLIDLLPGAKHLPWHRSSGAVHLFGILLCGIGLSAMLDLASSFQRRGIAACAALLLLLLLPAARERLAYSAYNGVIGEEHRSAIASEGPDVAALIARIKSGAKGRVFPGLASGRGKQLRIGSAPLFHFLSLAGLDSVAFAFHAMSICSDTMYAFDETRASHHALFGVRWVIDEAPIPAIRALARSAGKFGRFELWEMPTSSLFDVVDAPIHYDGPIEQFPPQSEAWLKSSLPDFKIHLLFDRDPGWNARLGPHDPMPDPSRFLPPGSAGTIFDEHASPGSYGASVNAARDAFVLLKMSWHPRWRATIDGRRAKTELLSPGFVGVRVPAGLHLVELTYDGATPKLVCLLLGAVLFVSLILFEARGRLAPVIESLGRIESWLLSKLPRAPAPSIEARIVIALTFFAGLFLFHRSPPMGHDTVSYPGQLVEFHENVIHGILLARWAPDFSSGLGQPIFLFRPPLLYWLAEPFMLMGASPGVALNLAGLSTLLISSAGMYRLASVRFGSKRAGALAASAYVLAPYFLTDLYVRGAFTELTSFAAFPWAFHAYQVAAKDDGARARIGVAASVALLFFSHNVAPVVFAPALLLWAAFLAADHGRRRILFACILPSAAGVAISAFFWLPCIALGSELRLEQALGGAFYYAINFIRSPASLFYMPWGFGATNEPGNAMPQMIGPVHLILFALATVLAVKRKDKTVGSLAALGAASMLMTLSISRPIWDALPVLQYFQFPWRFLGPATFFVSLAIASLARSSGSRVLPALMIAALFAFSAPKAWPNDVLSYDETYFEPKHIREAHIQSSYANAYEPKTLSGAAAFDPAQLRDDRRNVILSELTRSTPELRVIRAATNERVRALASLSSFPGWRAAIDGEPTQTEADPAGGRLAFALPKGDHLVQLEYGLAPVEKAARALSIAGIVALMVLCRLALRKASA